MFKSADSPLKCIQVRTKIYYITRKIYNLLSDRHSTANNYAYGVNRAKVLQNLPKK